METLACKDLGVDCGFVAKAETEEEVMKKMSEHAMKSHPEVVTEMSNKMTEVEMEDRMRSMIKEE